MMMAIMTNTYLMNKENGIPEIANVVTGLLGVYDDMEKAAEAWNESLRMLDVPEDKADLYDIVGHAYIWLNAEGKYVPTDSEDDEEMVYLLELMSKMIKPNVTYRTVS